MAHGSNVNFSVLAPRSRFYHGPYGRICPDLPAWSPDGVSDEGIDKFFLDLVQRRMIEKPGVRPGDIAGDTRLRAELEASFGSTIPAGYTYFGQFIDHDITFDPASSLLRRNDPSGIHNFRTPRLDLDSVYGRGPDDQPYLYDQVDKGKMLFGEALGSKFRDLPRNTLKQGRALIGDMRNDENAIVSQLHLAFLLAHNTLVDRARDKRMVDPFESARRTLRWLYQYVVWNDFVRKVTSKTAHQSALQPGRTPDGRMKWEAGLKDVYTWKSQPFIPVEFSAAAYRFGHSMVRNDYQTNKPVRGQDKPVAIFDNSGAGDVDDLRGFRPLEARNVIQWNWFLKMTSSPEGFPQMARRIRPELSNSLAFMHFGPAGSPVLRGGPEGSPLNVLAYRNLKRGWTFGLPSGTAMAKKYGIDSRNPLEEPGDDALWFYILREGELVPDKREGKLGPLGSLIVCATLAGLLKGDPFSYFNVDPLWTPGKDGLLVKGKDNVDDDPSGSRDEVDAWSLASIIRIAGLPVDAQDVTDQGQGRF